MIPAAIHEVLRYYGSVPFTVRVATEGIELGGQRIAPGERVAIELSAANRDPAVFSDPERFDISRDPNPHLAFGDFIHKCIGAPLALVEGQVALGTLVRRYPELRLAGAPEWLPVTVPGDLGLKRLPLHLGRPSDSR